MDLTEPFDFRFDYPTMIEDYRQTVVARCRRSLDDHGPGARVRLPLPGYARTTRRLWPGGPAGDVRDWVPGGTVVEFPARRILDLMLTASPEQLRRLGQTEATDPAASCPTS